MEYGNERDISPVEIKCHADVFENAIRDIGVEFACEWFGLDEHQTKNVINILCERSEIKEPYQLNINGEYN